MLILGIDDAGRGPIIGPMILAGALIESSKEEELKKYAIRDSKTVLHSMRVKVAPVILANAVATKVVKTFPNEIDDAINGGTNLNTLEAMKTAEIINDINVGEMRKEKIKVIVDCPSVNIAAWTATVVKMIKHIDNLQVVCEHKADANHLSVSAASILAKVAREEEVARIKKEYAKYGNIGSGYPSDPMTKEFLAKHGRELKDSGLFRKTWATWKNMFPEAGKKQTTLGNY